MKLTQISPHIYKLEKWMGLTFSAWLVQQDDAVIIVDTGIFSMADELWQQANKLGTPTSILLTHGHSDHVGGIKSLLAKKTLPVFVHGDEIKYMEGKEPYPRRKQKEYLVEPGLAQPLQVDSGRLAKYGPLTPYHTPGHSPGHVIYYHEDDDVVIGGDLFTSRFGKLTAPMAMFTGDMAQAIESSIIIETLQPKLVSICHSPDVKEPALQLSRYMKKYK